MQTKLWLKIACTKIRIYPKKKSLDNILGKVVKYMRRYNYAFMCMHRMIYELYIRAFAWQFLIILCISSPIYGPITLRNCICYNFVIYLALL